MKTRNRAKDCRTCQIRRAQFFCDLSLNGLQSLNRASIRAQYPMGAQLFSEGEPPRGIFVLCSGMVKVSTCSPEGRTIITRIAHPGDVLGLNAVVSGRPYGGTAVMIEPVQASFVPRCSVLGFIKEDPELALALANELSNVYYSTHDEVRTLGLATDAEGKLAKMLLSWSAKNRNTGAGDDSAPVRLSLSHEEIGETIGSCRETVSRLLSGLRRREVLQLRYSVLWIQDRPALEKLVQF